MKIKLIPALCVAAATLTALSLPGRSQPDPNNGARAENPPNRAVGVGGDMAGRALERARQQLIKFGVTDKTQQDLLAKFVISETAARARVLQTGRKLADALRADALDDAKIAGLLNEYQAALDDERVRRPKDLATFKKQYDYTKNPKIEAYLVLAGIVGDGPPLMTMGMAGGGMGMGGRGGQAGGQNPGGFNPGGFNAGGPGGNFRNNTPAVGGAPAGFGAAPATGGTAPAGFGQTTPGGRAAPGTRPAAANGAF